jgi:hypothetical protein
MLVMSCSDMYAIAMSQHSSMSGNAVASATTAGCSTFTIVRGPGNSGF